MKMHGGVLLASMLLAGMAATTAMAQSKADNGVYVGIEGAYAIPSNGTQLPAGFHTTSHSKAVAVLRALLGYQFDKNFGVELAYLTSGDFHQSASNGIANINARLQTRGEDLALVYRFTDSLPGLFVKAGASRTSLYSNVQTVLPIRTTTTNLSNSGTGYLMGLGYQRDLSDAVVARLSYTRYVGIGGQDSIKLNVFSAGVTYRF